jgi:hypothetical protein
VLRYLPSRVIYPSAVWCGESSRVALGLPFGLPSGSGSATAIGSLNDGSRDLDTDVCSRWLAGIDLRQHEILKLLELFDLRGHYFLDPWNVGVVGFPSRAQKGGTPAKRRQRPFVVTAGSAVTDQP